MRLGSNDVFINKNKKIWGIYLIKLFLLAGVIAVYFQMVSVQNFINSGFFYLRQHDFPGLKNFILSFGIWAPVTSILLMIWQSLFPIVPGLIVTVTNAWIFGWQYGALYSWLGALLGAILDFTLAKVYGRPLVEGLVNKKYLTAADRFFREAGLLAVLITRLTPVIPFKVISFGAGLTTMSFLSYSVATGLGQLPAIILYSLLGRNLTENYKIVIGVTSLFMIVVAGLFYYRGKIQNRIFWPRN